MEAILNQKRHALLPVWKEQRLDTVCHLTTLHKMGVGKSDLQFHVNCGIQNGNNNNNNNNTQHGQDVGRYNPVGIATGYGMDGPGIESQ